ncbi:MAG: hypothetical protein NVS3B25_07170 [Hymenobacter sp.]
MNLTLEQYRRRYAALVCAGLLAFALLGTALERAMPAHFRPAVAANAPR